MIPSLEVLNYLKAFLGGVGLSLTPCVYPLIPVTAGYIGASSAGSRLKGLSLSLVYVTGIAITYSLLGLFASLTGTLFGRVSSHPLTYILVGVLIVLFGLSMGNLFNIHFPRIIKPLEFKKISYFSVFVLGLSSGLVVAPCVTPVLGSILLHLAAKKDLLYGATLLLSFAYGMGLILILVGTFSGLLANLPKSGKWMAYIQKIFSLLLLAAGAYFIYQGLRRI
ncbi:MAG: cytochrome c biogenesis protein CcdA [Candidatus Omnitrophica bacterium]|nr:cytochrome c biogenesis protein CcdA [Candidatus Omnitrophota bacterium]